MTGLSFRLWHDRRLVPVEGWGCVDRAPQSGDLGHGSLPMICSAVYRF